MEVNDKTVLVTGTSTGIGRATALHLDQLGFRVIGTVRKESDADNLQTEASSRLSTMLVDVTEPDSLAQAQETLFQRLGNQGLWGLVNNAGVGFTSPLEFVPLEELRDLFEVNLFGLLAMTQICLPCLRQARGRIVNISSTASIVVAPFHGPYSASKCAVNALSNALRLELRPLGIQVATIICGSVRTPIWDTASAQSVSVWDELPAAAEEIYGPRYKQLSRYFQQIGQQGIAPDVAAFTIAQALTAERAKQTYYVGSDARLYRLMTKFLSERLRDWMIVRTIGLDN